VKKLFEINNTWFFTELPNWAKVFLVFVRGDVLVLLPLLVLVLLTALISIKFMAIMIGLYISVRYFGEMIYWFHQQFFERKYRPYDFGFKKLDNHAIYIIYQTISITGIVVGLGVTVAASMFMK
jgi:hypothetical protein